jgi:hypothetical protein
MVDYAKPVLDLVKEGPKRRQWLVNQLTPQIMSKRKLQKTLNELTDESKLVKEPMHNDGSGVYETWYMLPEHRYLLEVKAGQIIGAIERLKLLLLRMPTVDETAVEAGITPQEAVHLVYKLAAQTGWFNPTPELIHNARRQLGEVLVCAARIRQKFVTDYGKSEKFDYDEDAEIVEEAKRFLSDYPRLLPKLTVDGEKVIVWSQEALRFLGDNYVPEDRNNTIFWSCKPKILMNR